VHSAVNGIEFNTGHDVEPGLFETETKPPSASK
jgi:hypothetical protein